MEWSTGLILLTACIQRGLHGMAGALVKPWNRDAELTREHLNLRNSKFKLDLDPIELDCACVTCKNHTRGYLHHLLKTETSLAHTLLAQHNAFFMNDLLQRIRDALENDRFFELKREWLTVEITVLSES